MAFEDDWTTAVPRTPSLMQLERFAKLRDAGVLTETEFRRRRPGC